MLKTWLWIALLWLGQVWPVAHAAGGARRQVVDIKPLLIEAIDSADGQAHGVLVGDVARAVTARFAATSPILIDVVTLIRYRQPGCRRLRVDIWQDGVRLDAAQQPTRQRIEYGLNYCRDGLPPRELAREGAP